VCLIRPNISDLFLHVFLRYEYLLAGMPLLRHLRISLTCAFINVAFLSTRLLHIMTRLRLMSCCCARRRCRCIHGVAVRATVSVICVGLASQPMAIVQTITTMITHVDNFICEGVRVQRSK